jgi:hypothetical protein
MRRAMLLLLLAMSSAVAACGASASAKCDSSMTRLCEMACECTAGEACSISHAGALGEYTDKADCENYWVDLCDRPEEALPPVSFFSACASGLSNTTCLDEGEGSVIMPEECVM